MSTRAVQTDEKRGDAGSGPGRRQQGSALPTAGEHPVEALLDNDLESLLSDLCSLVGDIEISLFPSFPRSSLLASCVRARLEELPPVVWCANPRGCTEVGGARSWPAGGDMAERRSPSPAICAAVAVSGELRGVVKVAAEAERVLPGQPTVARLLGRLLTERLERIESEGLGKHGGVAQSDLAEAMYAARDAERERIGYELHDGVIQTLSATLYHLQAGVKKGDGDIQALLRRVERLLGRSIAETRSLLRSLTPPQLRGSGLAGVLRQDLRHLQEACGCSVEFEAERLELSERVSLGLYRIASEALSNVRRHAEPRRVRIDLKEVDGRVILEVADQGRGFDVGKVRRGTGLEGMRHRAEALGGIFSISTTPGEGTTIRVEVPVEQESADGE